MKETQNESVTFKTNVTNLVLLVEPTETLFVNNKIVRKKGKVIVFRNGLFSTKNQEEIKFIENLECFGKEHKDIIITKIN